MPASTLTYVLATARCWLKLLQGCHTYQQHAEIRENRMMLTRSCVLTLLHVPQKVEQQLQQSQSQLEDAQKQLAAAAALADTRLKEKAAADKEWADRLAAKDQETGSKLKEAEAKMKDLEDRGAQLLVWLGRAAAAECNTAK
jgi:chromosome segregation ATPase